MRRSAPCLKPVGSLGTWSSDQLLPVNVFAATESNFSAAKYIYIPIAARSYVSSLKIGFLLELIFGNWLINFSIDLDFTTWTVKRHHSGWKRGNFNH